MSEKPPTKPSTIRIFLADGVPDGLWMVSKSNWTGLALKCSRSVYKQARQREQFSRPGVYVLAGADDSGEPMTKIYIGEAGAIRDRLNTHLGSDDSWQDVVVFTGDESFNLADAKYIEARLIELGHGAKRAKVRNTKPMKTPQLSEADRADAEGFMSEMLTIYPILGINAFRSVAASTDDSLWFTLKGPDTQANGQRVADGFLVKAGATGRVHTVPSIHAYMVARRQELLDAGVLTIVDGKLKLMQDYTFTSPTLAGAVLLGRTVAGPVGWKDAKGRTLKAVEAAEALADGKTEDHSGAGT
jgi:hypothetical protein